MTKYKLILRCLPNRKKGLELGSEQFYLQLIEMIMCYFVLRNWPNTSQLPVILRLVLFKNGGLFTAAPLTWDLTNSVTRITKRRQWFHFFLQKRAWEETVPFKLTLARSGSFCCSKTTMPYIPGKATFRTIDRIVELTKKRPFQYGGHPCCQVTILCSVLDKAEFETPVLTG